MRLKLFLDELSKKLYAIYNKIDNPITNKIMTSPY